MDVEVTRLPGVGTKQEFTTEHGRRVGLLTYRDGRRDLLVSDLTDPDACTATVALSEPECVALGTLLGAPNLVAQLQAEHAEVPGVITVQIPVQSGSAYEGRTLGETTLRTRTGASIVAVVRRGSVHASPRPDFRFAANDLVVIVGTADGVKQAAAILEQG